MSRLINLSVLGPADPTTIIAELRPDFTPPITGFINPPGTRHISFNCAGIDLSIIQGAVVALDAPGFEPWRDRIRVGGNTDDIAIPKSDTELDAATMVPTSVPAPDPVPWLPRLVAAGQHFRKATGERFTAIEATDFHLLGRELNGEDTTAVLTQRAALGFNMLRVFTAYEIPNTIGRLHPPDHQGFYKDLELAMKRYNDFGFYVELVGFTGPYSTFFANDTEKIAHWQSLIATAKACPNVILELVNEADQTANKDLPFAKLLQPAAPVLAAHGSNGSQKWPVTPHWGYATFHTNDAFEWQRKDSHNAWEIWKGPTLTNETTRYTDKTQRVDLAYDSGRACALLCAGRCFHSVHGKNSTLFTGVELVAAAEVVRGAKSMPLSGQNLPYRHRKDLETPGLLRVYQRGHQPEHVVEIRK